MNVFLVIGALGLALLTAALAGVAIRRARAKADERIAEAVQGLAAGMEDMMRDLTDALEAAQKAPAAVPPERFVGELAATLDLDEVIERTLEAAASIPGVEAAILDVADPDAGSTVPFPGNGNLRAVETSYRYRIDDVEAASGLVRSSCALPLRADGLPVGTLSVFTRSSERPISEAELDELERLASKAGPALENARRYAEARALADLDALTGLHNRGFFHETLARELARAHRYGRRLTVIVFDLDNFKLTNDRVGHLAGDAVLAEAAERMLAVVRRADVACRVGGDEFAVVLPESGAQDGELLAGRIARAICVRPFGGAGTLSVSAGVAELRQGDRPNELFQRADDALYRAKELGKARTVAAEGA